jgi:hypothetical protein
MIQNVKPIGPAPTGQAQRIPLASLKPARVDAPWRILVHGLPGIGKTTFAAKMPAPIFICAERSGADEHEVVRWPEEIASFADLRQAIHRLTDEEHSFRSLVVDMVDDIEPLVWAEVIRKEGKGSKTIEDVGGGFMKGYTAALDEWRVFASDLERLQAKRGMNVLLLAHATRRDFKDPERPNYDRWEPNLNKKAAGFLVGWCKTVLFAQEETFTTKLDGEKAKGKGVSTGVRVLRTRYNPAYDAKNRHSLPDPLPLDAGAFADAMKAHRVASPEELRASIASKLEELGDPAVTEKVKAALETAGDKTADLEVINGRLEANIAKKGQ